MTLPASAPAAHVGHLDRRRVPRHVAVIMDGNGRWALGHGMSRSDGHRAGTENVRRTIEAFVQAGVEYLTLYAFSTENWDRPTAEVDALISIIGDMIGPETANLHDLGVKILHIGSVKRLPDGLRDSIANSIELTKHNSRLTLCVAFNYGSRDEILEAVRRMVAEGVDPESIDAKSFSSYLYTAGIPDPDLVIRTAGEMRLSNFLLWQSAYAEFYSTPVLWPDFDDSEVRKAIKSYSLRKRKFGRLDE